MNMELVGDFCHFSRLHVESGDVDPLYSVLGHVLSGRDVEEATWHALVYVAFYDLPSALLWLSKEAEGAGTAMTELGCYLPTGVERRSLRGGKNMLRHLLSLEDLAHRHGGLGDWLTHRFTGEPLQDWLELQKTVQQAWGNGRWAAYKTAEVCQKVLDFPVEPADMGNEGSTGPRKGLELLAGRTAGSVAELDAWGARLYERLLGQGVQLDLAEVETCLCDFHSMTKGHYYVGHDIDQLQAQTLKAGLPQDLEVAVWEARAAGLRREYLGEQNGWTGVDKARAKLYAEKGEILARH